MQKMIIIRAVRDGGKTTTAGLVYERLAEKASFKKLFTPAFQEQLSLTYREGSLMDFIAFILMDDTLVIIISPGDILEDLEYIFNKLDDSSFIKQLIGEVNYINIVFICCARSQNKTGSVYRMLIERVDAADSTEVWTKKSDNDDKLTVKQEVVTSIVQTIKSYLCR